MTAMRSEPCLGSLLAAFSVRRAADHFFTVRRTSKSVERRDGQGCPSYNRQIFIFRSPCSVKSSRQERGQDGSRESGSRALKVLQLGDFLEYFLRRHSSERPNWSRRQSWPAAPSPSNDSLPRWNRPAGGGCERHPESRPSATFPY